MNATKRVVLNTGFLYGKMLISMFIALYSTRIVLNALGANDFGIFNLVAGVIAMLAFLNAAMATSTQRYISYYLGANDEEKLDSVFKSSVILHLIIGILIVIALEISGLFLFNGFLNIPTDRIPAAKLVYQFMIVSTFFTINAVPYDATIIAHEKLLFESIIGVLESFFKLAIAITLIYAQKDRLILYSILLAGLTILIRIIKSIYCYLKFKECKSYRKSTLNHSLIKEMISFASWNMFGALCWIGSTQGIALVLNTFFGTVINAAFGIAQQVNSQLYSFSANMQKALNPQIIKNEGSGNRIQMLHLSQMASKFGFYLLALFAIPLIIEMPTVLQLWLKNVPENTVIFCRSLLIISLIKQLTIGSYTAIQATGNIKTYQPIAGTILLLNIPISYFILKQGFPASSVVITMIFMEVVSMNSSIYFWIKIAKLKLSNYINNVLLPTIIPTIISVLVISCIRFFLRPNSNLIVLIITCLSWAFTYFMLVYIIGTNKSEKQFLNRLLKSNFQSSIKK
ncbi:MATE family efflux transporter [Prolixibacteraceae bacterium Z1-6]|uniref:MATE family efflux transporter n=1 Tax=Draconibacterium aestuarii TaxID=2998507 RepID=A0A9X3J555_9BACT|nr:MATE family efflux transporter [Prolixibacteraceae bacterium Z1-6]